MKYPSIPELIAEHSPDATFLFDRTGNIVDVNDRACAVLGHSRAELLSTSMPTFDLDDAYEAQPDDGGATKPVYRESRFKHKDGSITPVELRLVAMREGITLALARGTAHRRKTNQALRLSEQQLREVIANCPIIMFAFDNTGKFILSEGLGLKALNLKPGELVGKSIYEFYKDSPQVINCCERALGGESVADTIEIGGLVYDSHYSPIMSDDDIVSGVIGVATDITFRRHAEEALRHNEEQLRQAQKMEAVGRLAGGVAHDFNNILTAIIGYGEVLQRTIDPSNVMSDHVKKILHAASRAAGLTRQLLAFSRKQVVTPKILDLNVVISESNQLLRRLIGEDIDLMFIPDPAISSVRADRSQVEQIVMNLAVNARDAMPRGGRLVIETSNVEVSEAEAAQQDGAHAGAHVMMQVTDTGIGMNKEVLAHLFEPFFTTKEHGTGLGLSTVYGVVKQNGGHLQVFSTPGKGTIFRIYLPQIDADHEESRLLPIISGNALGTETILLAEDEESVRALAVDALRSHGYTVLEAHDGADALAAAQRHRGSIHLLVTDMVMPKISGRELSEKLTQARPDLRVLFITGYTEDALSAHAVPRDNVMMLHKPFSINALVHRVREILEGSRKVS
jgi:PAS domain S-box-containing protein